MNNVVRVEIPRNQLSLIKTTVAKDCDDAEFNLFMHTARHLRLDPLRRQIYAFVFSKNDPKRRRLSIITSIDGFRTIADRTGNYRPDDEEPEYEVDQALISSLNPIGLVKAKVKVFKFSHSEWHKVSVSAYWDEYAPIKDEWVKDNDRDKNIKTGKIILDTSGNWGKMPRLMLAKVAEALALRKAWPDDLSSVYAEEEMDKAKLVELLPTEELEIERVNARMERIGGKSILFDFSVNGVDPLEAVPSGKVADKVFEFISKHEEEPSFIQLWKEKNHRPLQEFWAHSPNDALEVKKALELVLQTGGST